MDHTFLNLITALPGIVSFFYTLLYIYNVSKACILVVSETIWNCREIDENYVSKTCILVVSETIWNCREIVTSKACIVTVLETI